MRTRKFIVGLEFSISEKRAGKLKRIAKALKVLENPVMSFKVVVSDEVSYTPVRCPRLKNPAEGSIRFMADLLNAQYFSDTENELRYVKGRDENGKETFSLRLCGKNSDAFHFADGEDGITVTGRTESLKELYDSVRTSEKAKIFEHLRDFALEHERMEPFSDETSAAAPEEANGDAKPETKDPLSWRPETDKSPVPRSVLDARLKSLSDGDAKVVRDTVGMFPEFAALYCGGTKGDASENDGKLTDTELKLLHLLAYVSDGEDGEMRIFRSSGAYDPKKPDSLYRRAAAEARTEAAKFKEEHRAPEAAPERKQGKAPKEGDYGKEI